MSDWDWFDFRTNNQEDSSNVEKEDDENLFSTQLQENQDQLRQHHQDDVTQHNQHRQHLDDTSTNGKREGATDQRRKNWLKGNRTHSG